MKIKNKISCKTCMGEASSEALPAWAKLQAKPCPVQIKETNKPMDVRCPNKMKLVQLVKDVPKDPPPTNAK